jgi:hypothetical protein
LVVAGSAKLPAFQQAGRIASLFKKQNSVLCAL